MQAQQEFRINAPPLTATFVLVVGLALGAIGGYAIATAERSMTQAIPSAAPVQRVVPQSQAPQVGGSSLTSDDGAACMPNFTPCIDPGNSPGETLMRQLPASPPAFDVGRMCASDFTVCREPQNSYD